MTAAPGTIRLPMVAFRSTQSLIEMIRRAGGARGRQITDRYSIEGIRLVERALRAGAPLEAALIAERLARSADPRHRDLLAALRAAGCPVTVVPDAVLAELTEGRDLGPILGLVKLPPPVRLAELLGQEPTADGRPPTAAPSRGEQEPSPNLSQGERDATADQQPTTNVPSLLLPRSLAPPLFLAAADIVDPGNVGALTRTAHAGGARGLLASGASDPFHPRATRISRGSIFKLPVIRYESVAAMLDDLRGHNVFTVATAAGAGTPLPEVIWPAWPTAVLLGNEAEGLPPEVAGAVDLQVTIPMAAGVDSYSVNAAAAIVLYVAQAVLLAEKAGGGGAGDKES
jgi:TrmH family RNA methyltransferase